MASILKIGEEVHRNSIWLGSELVDLADEALSAYEDAHYAQVIVRCGAVFEGLLGGLLGRAGESLPSQPGLGTMIGCLRKTGRMPSELLERLDEANRIRNRAPHKKALKVSKVTEGDALQMVHILYLVVQWVEENHFPSCGEEVESSLTPVFLSVGAPHRLVQQQFLQRLRSEMRALGVEL